MNGSLSTCPTYQSPCKQLLLYYYYSISLQCLFSDQVSHLFYQQRNAHDIENLKLIGCKVTTAQVQSGPWFVQCGGIYIYLSRFMLVKLYFW